MQRFWDENIPINHKIALLAKSGLNWTDLCIWQIEELPTLKEETLKRLAEKEEAKKKEEEARIKKEQADKYYKEHFDEIMIEKIDKCEELTEKELSTLVFEGYEIERLEGENRRWQRTIKSIIKLNNRYFAIIWEEGLTENQENEFYNQPYEVELDSYKRIYEVRNWNRKGSQKIDRVNEFKNEISDSDIYNIIDKVTEFMYCNYEDCHMEKISWNELQKVRDCIKENAMSMIKRAMIWY